MEVGVGPVGFPGPICMQCRLWAAGVHPLVSMMAAVRFDTVVLLEAVGRLLYRAKASCFCTEQNEDAETTRQPG